MADNRPLDNLTGNAALDEVTYSGDTAVVQLVRNVQVTGAEGSKTVVENMPASLGPKVSAASFPVVLATDAPAEVNLASASITALSVKLVDAGGDALPVDAGGGGVTVDLGTNNDVTVAGVATAANQATAIGHLDGVEGLLTTIDADTSRIPALGQATMANSVPVAIASNQGAVPVSAASLPLPTGAATEANQTTEIGHLLNTSAATGTVGDAIASVGASGTVSAKLRRVTQGLEDLKAGITALPLPSGAATAAKQDTEITALQLLDDTVAVLGTDLYTEATTKGLTVGAVRRDADTTLVGTTNEIGPLQMDANGRLKVEAFSGETLPVSGTVTANAGSGTQAVSLATAPALVAGSANIGDVDIASIAAGDNNIGNVDIVTMPNVTIGTMAALVAGSAAIGKLAANSGVDIGDVDVLSIVPGTGATNLAKAVDSVGGATDTGVAMLGLREDALVTITPADADYARFKMDSLGRQWVNPGLSPELYVSKTFNATTTQTGIDVWDPGAGKKIAVSSVIIGTYGTTAARVILWFGDNADTTYTAGTDQVLLAASFAPSATAKPGLTIAFARGNEVVCNTADRELHITTDAGISIDVTVHGFEF